MRVHDDQMNASRVTRTRSRSCSRPALARAGPCRGSCSVRQSRFFCKFVIMISPHLCDVYCERRLATRWQRRDGRAGHPRWTTLALQCGHCGSTFVHRRIDSVWQRTDWRRPAHVIGFEGLFQQKHGFTSTKLANTSCCWMLRSAETRYVASFVLSSAQHKSIWPSKFTGAHPLAADSICYAGSVSHNNITRLHTMTVELIS